ncbi:MAG: hypothetical protein CMN76_14155 [Spirochaetaceae bacterium]|nr:hypothetical protein [Spirochaetaceae bacterium]
MKMRRSLWPIRMLALASAVGLGQCSSIDAFWYAKPDFAIRYSEGEHTAARIEKDGILHTIWAYSGTYTVMRGPCPVPMWDAEPPILNHQTLSFHWKIEGERSKFPLEIHRKDLQIVAGDRIFGPANFYKCDIIGDEIEGERDFNYRDGDILTLHRPECMVFRYYDLQYSEVDEFYFRPTVYRNGRQISSEPMRFRSRRNYSYTPYEFPFMYMPVR